MNHRRIAVATIAAAVVMAGLLGLIDSWVTPMPLWHAEFCATANAVTDGCDTVPHGWGYLITWLEYLLVVPLFAATFSLFTSSLTAIHVHRAKAELKEHVTAVITDAAPPS